MKKKRFAEEQIISILKEHEAGATAAALSRRLGSASSPSNAGKRNTEVWRFPMRSGFAHSKRKMPSSSGCIGASLRPVPAQR